MKRHCFICNIFILFILMNGIKAQTSEKIFIRQDLDNKIQYTDEFIEGKQIVLIDHNLYTDLMKYYNCTNPSNEFGNDGMFILSSDQDILAGSKLNEDRDYTMGVDLTWHGEGVNNGWLLLPWVPYFLDKVLLPKKFSDSSVLNHSFSLGISGFTPFDLESIKPDSNDRPYCALLYLKTGRHKVGRKHNLSTNFTLGYFGGFVGAIGRGAQSGIHTWQRVNSSTPLEVRPNPLGWHNVLSQEGIPFIQFDLTYSYNYIKNTNFILLPFSRVDFGMIYDAISVGVKGQYGIFEHDIISISSMGSPFNFKKYAAKRTKPIFRKQFHAFLNGSIESSLWLYNATLLGIPFFNSNDVFHLNHDQMRKFTFFYSLGFGLGLNNTIVKYDFYFRSPETHLNVRNHYWGRISILNTF